jgi:uncharacterized protein YbjT (DUF2867 family)
MRVILFGASGMVGQGVLRECVLDSEVLSVVRRETVGPKSEKVRELVTNYFYDFTALKTELAGYDACFFCLGVSSLGMKEAEYRRVTYDIAMAAARTLLVANPTTPAGGMTFVYVSGAGTDAQGRQMWARVKGETENALLAMPFRAAYMFRPGGIVPMHGVRSKTAAYRILYWALTPVLGLLQRMFPQQVTTTEQVGRAMLGVAKQGYPKRVLEAVDIASF